MAADRGARDLACRFEERDLIAQFGDRYRVYRERVGMLLPRSGKAPRQGPAER
jgi:methanethiol S-methyltransferase